MAFDTDSIAAEKERPTQPPKPENAPMVWASTSEWGANEWRGDQNYQAWLTNGRGGSIPKTQHTGSFANAGKWGGRPTFGGNNIKTGPGCKAYKDTEWALKTNERSIVKKHAFIKGYTNYGDCEAETMRWERVLYNHPKSLGAGGWWVGGG